MVLDLFSWVGNPNQAKIFVRLRRPISLVRVNVTTTSALLAPWKCSGRSFPASLVLGFWPARGWPNTWPSPSPASSPPLRARRLRRPCDMRPRELSWAPREISRTARTHARTTPPPATTPRLHLCAYTTCRCASTAPPSLRLQHPRWRKDNNTAGRDCPTTPVGRGPATSRVPLNTHRPVRRAAGRSK
jgi:hypothetical protein